MYTNLFAYVSIHDKLKKLDNIFYVIQSGGSNSSSYNTISFFLIEIHLKLKKIDTVSFFLIKIYIEIDRYIDR